MEPTQERHLPKSKAETFQLSPSSSRRVKAGLDYSGYFQDRLSPTSAVTARMASFAANLGARATLVLDGAPFMGMTCHVAFDALSPAEVTQFETEFQPAQSTAIAFLEGPDEVG